MRLLLLKCLKIKFTSSGVCLVVFARKCFSCVLILPTSHGENRTKPRKLTLKTFSTLPIVEACLQILRTIDSSDKGHPGPSTKDYKHSNYIYTRH